MKRDPQTMLTILRIMEENACWIMSEEYIAGTAGQKYKMDIYKFDFHFKLLNEEGFIKALKETEHFNQEPMYYPSNKGCDFLSLNPTDALPIRFP